jgi:hypothetical protein
VNVTTASVQLRVLNNSVYLSARLKLRGTNNTFKATCFEICGSYSCDHECNMDVTQSSLVEVPPTFWRNVLLAYYLSRASSGFLDRLALEPR